MGSLKVLIQDTNMLNKTNEKGAAGAIAGVVIAIVVIGGIIWASSSSQKGNDSMIKDDKMMSDEVSMMQKGGYESYSPEKLTFAENGNVVLFFHASWCPYCRTAEADINKNTSSIPSDLLILKTDYDTQTALKQKYGVTVQHTFVQVDKDGNQITKWIGSESLAEIVSKVK